MQNPGKVVPLQESETFLALINSLPLKIFVKDSDGKFIHANESYCTSLGLKLEEIIGHDDYDIHPQDLAEKYRKDDCRIMAGGKTESIEEKWQTLEGDEHWVQVVKAPLRGADQQILGTIGVFFDITERKVSELKRAEERNLLRTLIDNLPDWIYVKDTESRFMVANEPVAKLLGLDNSDILLGKTDHDFFDKIEADKFRADEKQVISSGKAIINVEEPLTDSAGNVRYVKTTKVPLKSLNHEIIGIIGIGHDITEERAAGLAKSRLEQQLYQAQKMETIGTLTAGIAHDFNNLLSVINGYAELMSLTSQDNPKNQEIVAKILTAGRSAAKLVSQLLAFSRKQAAQSMVIDINHELNALSETIRGKVGEKIHVEMRLATELWAVRIDPAQFEQVVFNLVTNAREAMAEGGHLIIETANVAADESGHGRFQEIQPGEWVQLVVTDTGSGIMEEAKNHIFEPFFTTKSKQQGRGLGLATVFGIVKQNKGYVYATNHPGGGAEFTIYLPKTNDPISTTSSPSFDDSMESLNGVETILLVEDDPEVRSLTRTILMDYGYTVYSAGNGAEALFLVEQNGKDINLVLTDVVMPGMNGNILVREILRKWPEMKVIYMSGYTDNALSDHDGLLEDNIDFLQKPFTKLELVRLVRGVIDREE